jgi:pyruvate-formate lyase-activating enzyme
MTPEETTRDSSRLAGPLKALLARQGWTIQGWRRNGKAGFRIGRPGKKPPLFDIILDRAARAAPRDSGSLAPSFRLRCRRLGGAGKPPQAAEEMLSALGALLESLHSRKGDKTLSRTESHEGRDGRSFLLRSTFACNQKCPFCSVSLSRHMIPATSLERELDLLAREADRKQVLTISGGEPTVDPQLLRIIASARRRGFRQFMLQTNAVLLTRPGLLGSLIKLGVTRYFVSFHSHRQELYDRITGSRGQYPAAVAGLTEVLRAKDCRITVNAVVNALNYRELPALIDFLGGLRSRVSPRRRLEVYLSMINETGHEKAPAWAVSLDQVAPYLRRALARCRALGLPVGRFGGESSFPVCLLPSPRRYASPGSLPQDRVRYTEDFSGAAGSIGHVKKPACRRCPFDGKCQGVPATYARMFGLAALRPPRPRRARRTRA